MGREGGGLRWLKLGQAEMPAGTVLNSLLFLGAYGTRSRSLRSARAFSKPKGVPNGLGSTSARTGARLGLRC